MSIIVKKSLLKKSSLLVPAALLLLGSATSCNEKSKDTEEIAVTISTVAVKSFNLKADTKVLTNLDSVFFSIDLDNGVIFNADSLPLGTKVSKLIPVITFMTTMSKAEIIVSEDGKEDQTFDYLKNANDSIDFSKKVTLKVTAYDQTTQYSYRLKVNVHTQKPDSLMWDRLAVATLPSRYGNPAKQHSVQYGDKVVSILEESNGELTLASSSDLFKGVWDKSELSLPFTPDIATFTASPDALWMLDDAGTLYTSSDGSAWTATEEKWLTIVGPYLNSVLGVKQTDNGLLHCHYPADPNIADTPVDPAFPISGRSAMVTVASEWSEMPTAFFVGGVKPDMTLSDATWAFDGSVWTTIDDISTPAIKSPVVVPYTNNRRPGDPLKPYEANAWFLIGGVKADGSFNDVVYYTYDNGVTWRRGSALMQLPDYIPYLEGADGVVLTTPLTADLTDYWKSIPSAKAGMWLKPAYTVDGYDITWECPYIYLIGGYGLDGSLSDSIWRGVMARLAFTPLF